MGLSVPQANVDCRGQGGRIPREDGAQVLQREEFFQTGMARLLLWPCSMKIADYCTFHVTN